MYLGDCLSFLLAEDVSVERRVDDVLDARTNRVLVELRHTVHNRWEHRRVELDAAERLIVALERTNKRVHVVDNGAAREVELILNIPRIVTELRLDANEIRYILDAADTDGVVTGLVVVVASDLKREEHHLLLLE